MAKSKFYKELQEEIAHKKEVQEKLNDPNVWKPQQGPQMAFHESPVFELMYGGAAGGGKSDSLLVEALRQVHVPDYRAIIFRRTYPELEKSLVPRAYELLYGQAKPKNKGLTWKFPSGATLYLSHLQREEDKEKHKSAEYDYIGFDELTSFTESQYTYLFSRCRGKNPDITRKIRSATNPTGIGHGWVKQRFLDPHLQPNPTVKLKGYVEYDYAFGWRYKGKIYRDFTELPDGFHKGEPAFETSKYNVYHDKSGLTRAFIPALLWGNERLITSDPEYVKRLGVLPHKQQQALLYGSWDLFEGQFFSQWDPDEHVVEPFTIPQHWQRFVAIDYGYSAPAAAIWFALSEEGIVYAYRELYQNKLTSQDQAHHIQDMSKDEHIEWFTADPSMFSQSGVGESHAHIYARHGVDLMASSNKRVAGWAILHEYLSKKRIKFFTSCPNSIRTLPTLIHSKTNPEDLDTTQEDHAADAIRYFLLTLKGQRTHIKKPGCEEIPDWWATVKSRQKKKKTATRRARIG